MHYDLYFCEKCDGGTGIARFGDDGDYYSSPFCKSYSGLTKIRFPNLDEDTHMILGLFAALPTLLLSCIERPTKEEKKDES